MPTIYEVAELAGVSITTVSRVLNGTGKVSADTKKRVLKAMEKLNFRPNLIGQLLGRSQNTTILAVLPLVAKSVNPAICLTGIKEVVTKEKYDLIISFYDDIEKGPSPDCLKYTEQGLAGGCIFITGEYLDNLPKINVPTVFVSELPEASYDNCIIHSTRKSAYDITKRLIDRGRRNFAFVHMFSRSGKLAEFSQERFYGMQSAMEDCGLKYNSANTLSCPSFYDNSAGGDADYDAAIPIIEQYTKMPQDVRPDVIVCANDTIALACVHTLQRAGIAIPHDVAVVGFDNSLQVSYSSPQITSVQSPFKEFGIEAAKMLISLMKGEITGGRQLRLNPTIIERGSTDPQLK